MSRPTYSIPACFFALAFASCTPTVYGQSTTLEGRLRSTGSEGNVVATIQQADGKSLDVCSSTMSKRIARLSGMKVRLIGSVRAGKIECFDASEFTVTDTGSGREALVGTLGEDAGAFFVQKDDGSRRSLDKVPPGLRKYTGKKVIIDVKTVDGSKESESKSLRVVTYSEFP